MVQLFKDKLKDEGRSKKWFWEHYLPGYRYIYFIQEINGFKKMTDEVKNAILKYVNEG